MVPFGGGTSVVGGVTPGRGRHAAVVALDLQRMDRLLSVDPVSLTAVFEPGVRGPEAERLLAPHGLTLGHFPQSYEHATLGGYAATRSAGQASTGYGRFDDLVLGLQVQTPAGPLDLGRGAASAAGPDLRGPAGRQRGRPRRRHAADPAGAAGARGAPLRRPGLPHLARRDRAPCARSSRPASRPTSPGCPTRTRPGCSSPCRRAGLKGAALTTYLASRGAARGCLAVLGWEGTAKQVAVRRALAKPLLTRSLRLPGAGARWEHGRYGGPYLRDDLLDAGVLVETLETSATWTDLDRVRSAVRSAVWTAMLRTPPIVMCHVSHLYPHGASLYFTVITRQDAADPDGQWQRAKAAASQAHRRRRCHHHPPPRGRHRPRGPPRRRGRPARRAGPAGGQGGRRPDGRHEPRHAARGGVGVRRLQLVVNPRAGGGRAARLLPAVEAALRAAGHDLRVTPTTSLEHADALTADAVDDERVVVAMGGDGLVGRVAAAVADAAAGCSPSCRAAAATTSAAPSACRREPVAACAVVDGGVERAVDLGVVTSAGVATPFLGIASVGFDSDVQERVLTSRVPLGPLVYLYGSLAVVAGWRHATFTGSADGVPFTLTGWSVAVANSGVYGGGMRLAPGRLGRRRRARPGHQCGDQPAAVPARAARGLLAAPTSGGRASTSGRVRTVELDADRPFRVFADGDPVGSLPCTVTVRPGALRVLLPRA